MKKSNIFLNSMNEASEKQEYINDLYRAGRSVLDIKDILEKIVELKKNPDLKKAIKKLQELDVDIEYLVHQFEKMDHEKE